MPASSESPAPTVLALLRPSLPLVLGGATGAVLPGVVLSAELHYFSRTQRPTVGRTTPRWQIARPQEEGATQAQQDGNARPAGWAARWAVPRCLHWPSAKRWSRAWCARARSRPVAGR